MSCSVQAAADAISIRLNSIIEAYFFLQVFSKILFREKGGKTSENMSHAKCSRKSMKPLREELKLYQKSGIQLFMDGEPSTPKDIAKACLIAEGGGYMRDYTEDESGRIARVDFDRISEAPRKKYRYR